MSIIHDMARLLLINPSITAKELAEKMGYAEEKSVYYWLNKAGFSGMKDFRKKVLSRQIPIDGLDTSVETTFVGDRPQNRRHSPESGNGHNLPQKAASREFSRLPIYRHLDRARPDHCLGDYFENILTRESFGIISQNAIKPWVETGDLVIIDPLSPPNQGDIFAVGAGEPLRLVRWYALSDRSSIWVDIENPQKTFDPIQVTGKVICIIRNLKGKNP